MTPFWVTAFLDLAPDEHDRAVEHWRGVTGYELSAPRGEHDEFATLVPPDGDDYLRVQRLGSGPSRIHLDLHVTDPAAAADEATELGARVVARPDPGYVVLESPGGFPFCYVGHHASTRPVPARWQGELTSFVDQVCLDIPSGTYERECRFWSELTGWGLRHSPSADEFSRLVSPDRLAIQLLLQKLGEPEGRVRAHLDLSTSDRAAETARHEALGAAVADAREVGWTVMTPPAGPTYCITDRKPALGMLP